LCLFVPWCLRGSKITNVQCDLISYLNLMFEFANS